MARISCRLFMKRIAVIKNYFVENVALWDGISPWNPPDCTLIDITNTPVVNIGWIYNGDVFIKPEISEFEDLQTISVIDSVAQVTPGAPKGFWASLFS